MEHQKIRELYAPYLDELLTAEDKALFEEHLKECPECEKELQDIKVTVEAIKSMPLMKPPSDIAAKVKNELLVSMQTNKFSKLNFSKFDLRFLGVAAAFIFMIVITIFGPDSGNGVVKKENQILSKMDANTSRGIVNTAPTTDKAVSPEMTRGIAAKTDSSNTNYEIYTPTERAEQIIGNHKIIKSAEVEIRIKKYQNFYTSVNEYLQKITGYIESSSLNKDAVSKKYSATLVIRIPEAKFQNTLNYLQTLGEFQRQSTTSQDVTTQYIDTDARIKALETQIKVLQGLLEKSKNVDEMIRVQNELSRVQGEHDSLVSQNKFLDRAASYATITIFANEEDVPQDKISTEEKNIFSRAKAGFIRSINGIIKMSQNLFVELVSILPQIMVILSGVAILILIAKIKTKK